MALGMKLDAMLNSLLLMHFAAPQGYLTLCLVQNQVWQPFPQCMFALTHGIPRTCLVCVLMYLCTDWLVISLTSLHTYVPKLLVPSKLHEFFLSANLVSSFG